MPQYHYKRIFNCCFAELINGHFLHIFSTFFSAKAAPWLVAMAKVPKYSRPGCWCSAWGPGRPKAIPGSFSETPQRNLLTWGFPVLSKKGGRGMSNVAPCYLSVRLKYKEMKASTLLPCVNFALFFWAAFEKDPGRSFPRARTCADDSAQKLGATPLHTRFINWLGVGKNGNNWLAPAHSRLKGLLQFYVVAAREISRNKFHLWDMAWHKNWSHLSWPRNKV